MPRLCVCGSECARGLAAVILVGHAQSFGSCPENSHLFIEGVGHEQVRAIMRWLAGQVGVNGRKANVHSVRRRRHQTLHETPATFCSCVGRLLQCPFCSVAIMAIFGIISVMSGWLPRGSCAFPPAATSLAKFLAERDLIWRRCSPVIARHVGYVLNMLVFHHAPQVG